MKTITHKRILLLIPALLVLTAIIALMPSFRASASSVRLSKSHVNLYTSGGRKKIHLYLYEDGKKVKASWTSSKSRVASVSSSGVVRAKRTGTAKITARYAGMNFTCSIKVRRRSGTYKKAIKAYNTFLMNTYVTYTDSGDKAQADNFTALDLDKNGIPELLVNVVTPDGDRHYVLYRYKNKKISIGQQLGVCSDFVWYDKKGVLSYWQYMSNESLFIYGEDSGSDLETFAVVRRKNGKNRYYIDTTTYGKGYGRKVSALEFRNYVDHDVLNYTSPKAVPFYINTPYNRSVFLK